MFTKAVLPDTLRALKLVAEFDEIKDAYLAGGTALALQIGHRISVDLDFFTQQTFDETVLSQKLRQYPAFVQAGTAEWTVWGKIGETKFSIFYYPYPLLEKTIPYEGLHIASLKDISAMKIHAIEERGTKRDFIDVYFLAKYYSLLEMLGFYQKKYGVLEDHLYFILRALDYFEDAEQEIKTPDLIIETDWEEVKAFMRHQTTLLIKEKLHT